MDFGANISHTREVLIDIITLTILIVLFTALVCKAAFILIWNNWRRPRSTMMLSVILTMWAFTMAYWVVTIVVAFRLLSSFEDQVQTISLLSSRPVGQGAGGSSVHATIPTLDSSEIATSSDWELPRLCAATSALTVNAVLSDAIVWWRALILWRKKIGVYVICVSMLLTTLIMGLLDAIGTCTSQTPPPSADSPSQGGSGHVGSIFGGTRWGVAAGALTLSTNVVATSLVAYKAWQHRRFVRSYVGQGSRSTRAERILTLLVESGALYSLIWIGVITYQGVIHGNINTSAFSYGFYFVIEGCLIPVVGMYPTLIIIICALNKSPCETQFAHRQDHLLPSLTGDTAVSTLPRPDYPDDIDLRPSEKNSRDRTSVLVLGTIKYEESVVSEVDITESSRTPRGEVDNYSAVPRNSVSAEMVAMEVRK